MAHASVMKGSFDAADEVRDIPNGRMEIVRLGDVEFGRTVFRPGWRWSESVKPIAGTESCQFPHAGFVVQGALHVRMDDGTEMDVSAGDVAVISPGHDAWVVGDEDLVMYDIIGDDRDYAKPSS